MKAAIEIHADGRVEILGEVVAVHPGFCAIVSRWAAGGYYVPARLQPKDGEPPTLAVWGPGLPLYVNGKLVHQEKAEILVRGKPAYRREVYELLCEFVGVEPVKGGKK